MQVGRAGLRIVFLGMRGAASRPPLAGLLEAGFDVQWVYLADCARGRGQEVAGLARAAGIRHSRAGGVEPVLGLVDELRPDAVVVACFPWKLPKELLELPPLGCLNVHPSLLPVGRGAEPVFWTLRRGERRTGVTVYRMDAGLDTGPVVAQEAIDVPEGIRAPELERRLNKRGARLLADTLPKLAAGAITPVPHDDALATSAPLPTAADYAVPTNLPARWAYAFVRGVAPLGGPLELLVGATGERYRLRDAVDYEPDGGMAEPVVDVGAGVLRVRFRPGVVRFTVAG